MQTFAKVLAVCFLAGAASLPVVAQTSGGCQSVSPPLRKTDTCIHIDTADPMTQALRQPNMVSGDRVYIELIRKPVEKCSIQLKTDIIQPPPSGITTFLKTMKVASVPGEEDECQKNADKDVKKPSSTKSAAVTKFETESALLYLSITSLNGRIGKQRSSYTDVAENLTSFQNCKRFCTQEELTARTCVPGTDICKDQSFFGVTRDALIVSLDKVLSDPIPTSTLVDFELKNVQDTLTKEIPDTDPWFANKANQFACYDSEVAGLKAHLTDVTAGRQQFAKIIEVVRGLDWPATTLKFIPPQKNAKVTATVSCTNVLSGDATIDPVSVIVSYTDIPRTSSTVGVLLTFTPKQVIGSTAVKTGESGGVPTFKNVFAVTSSAPVQAIPFTFLNVRLHYWRFRSDIFTLNATGGIGVNPYSGTNQVEYFVGPSFGIGDLSIDFGAHIGEFQNLGGGFLLGQTVPSGLSKIPVKTKYTVHPSIGFTYRLPLP